MSYVFLGATAYLLYNLTIAPVPWTRDEEHLKTEAHKYSGIHPDEYQLFTEQMALCEQMIETQPRQAATHLYQALDHMRNLGTHNRYGVEDEIHELTLKIGLAVEKRILRSALKKGVNWTPTYLNNTHVLSTNDDEIRSDD
jgi:hypothetical protein